MSILEAIITACGGALVTGIITLIKDKRSKDDKISKALEGLKQSLKELGDKLDDHVSHDYASKADATRNRILHFGDECKRGTNHTEEHWKEMLHDIDKYETYCKDNPEYKNSRAVQTIDFLKERYQAHLKNNDFLV